MRKERWIWGDEEREEATSGTTFALSQVFDSWTACQQRQLKNVAEFTNKIIHVPGRLNIVTDLMSRPP